MDQLKPSSANSCPLTPLTFLERAAIVYGDSPSVVYNSTAHTWSETHRRCLKLASSISDLGITKGQVVSVLAPNVPAMYELQFAVPMSGAVLNNLNTRLNSPTIAVLLRHSESKLVFVDAHFAPLLCEAVSSLENPPLVVIIEDSNVAAPPLDVATSGGVIPPTYEDLVEKGDEKFEWVRPESEWDPMTLNYTSGTTSSPKGVVHSHRAIFTITVDSIIDWSVQKYPVYLWTLPMFHSNGWSFSWGMAAVGGANICLRKFDAAVIFAAVIKHNVTHMCGAPVVLNMLSNSPSARPLPHRVHFLTGGAPPPAAVLIRTEALGFVVSHGYGLTEVAGVVVSCAWKGKWDVLSVTEKARLRARQGVRTIGLTAVDVVDPESGIGVKWDGLTQGEVVLRGGCLMLGYLKDTEGTSKCMRENGWLYTGDVAVIHPDGYLEIKDRSKDVIITGGENVSSVEVESVLYTHMAVNEVAVVARPDKFWGETPCAFVSLKDNGGGQMTEQKPTSKDIILYCRERLPHYMVPKTVVFMEELPKTATGKIKKFKLRDLAKEMGSLYENSRM